MLNTGQEWVLKKLAEIEKQLPDGVSLTFAVDNLIETMEDEEWKGFMISLHKLIDDEYLMKHTKKETKNRVPFWLEFTNKGHEYCRKLG
jgi:hypothetical protein